MTISNDDERWLPIAEHVGGELHRLMWKQKVSQTEAGRVIGIGQTTMGKKLRGEVPITVDELVALAGLLKVSPTDLLPSARSEGFEPPTFCFGVSHLQLVHSVRECLTPELPLGLVRPRHLAAVS